eukprot:1149871-Pelagomonas_calceolata.AAC.3
MFLLTAIRASMLLRLFEQKRAHSICVGALESIAILLSAAAVAWSRVYLGYHTLEQVQAAAAIGAGLGIAWVWLMARLDGAFSYVSTSTLGQWMNLKNSWGVADVLHAECIMYHSTAIAMPTASKSKAAE